MACCGQKAKPTAKLADLAAKTKKGGDDVSVKGGATPRKKPGNPK